MDWMVISLCGISAFLFWCLMTRKSSRTSSGKTPPEQTGLPILGYVPFLRPNRYVALTALQKKLGDIFVVTLFNQKMLIINSLEGLREALINQADNFAVRPIFKYIDSFTDTKGLVFTSGEIWQSHRRFVLRALRELGFGKADSVKAIHQEVSTLVDFIESSGTKAVSTSRIFSHMTSNVICALAFGTSFVDDANYEDLLKTVDLLIKIDSRTVENFPNYFPAMLDYPFIMNIYHRFAYRRQCYTTLRAYMLDTVIKHKASIDEVTQPDNLVDIMLQHRCAMEERGETNHHFDDVSIAADLMDLFVAGSDTTATSLSWAVVLLSVHPEIQRRAREEIRNEIGLEQLPTMKDRPKLHYASAVLDEISRFASIAPTALFHKTKEDTTLCGYHIPRDTNMIPNLYAIHMDPRNWANPSTFDPNHFLSKDGMYQPSDYLVPFSLGKRACLGESLARMELFIFFISILQRYEVSLAKEDETNVEQILKGDDGLVRHLTDHKVVFKAVE